MGEVSLCGPSEGRRRKRAVGLSAGFICILFLSGCGFYLWDWWSADEVRVDVGVVSDIRSVGRVLAKTTYKFTSEDRPTVQEILMIDTGGSSARESLGKAVNKLRSLGWKVVLEKPPRRVLMKSDNWGETDLLLTAMNSYVYDEVEEPQIAEAVKTARARSRLEAIVVVEAVP